MRDAALAEIGRAEPEIDATKRATTILNPFTVIVDSREQRPYAFLGLSADAKQKSLPLTIPTVRGTLHDGDYSIQGMETCLIERKSKEDLYGSVAKRDNFIGRLERMNAIAEAGGYCCVMVECNDVDLLDRPKHSRLAAKSLNRTIIAWRQRYRVDWYFCSTRERAEAFTFRILERFWNDRQGRQKSAK
ncbi:ERCC4 domain-containing protein [Singulisphaera sp. Ch08]|uniref:ERCC4 domain-containing protein n=1 Tax=Singulisphaera sp. Ch08 TaxID=3120278 RepID=A0AAU7CKY4_9BACT